MVAKIAGGSGVLNDALAGANNASSDLLAAALAAGYLRPSQIGAGGDSFLPTLSRQQMENDMLINSQDASTRRYSAENAAQLGNLNLLAGLRGPSNAIRYNYLLNKMPAPSGTTIPGTSGFQQNASPNPSSFPATMPPIAKPPTMLPNMGLPAKPPAATPQAPAAGTPAAQQLSIAAGTLPSGEKPISINGTKATYAGGVTWDLALGPPPAQLTLGAPGVGYEPTGMSAQQPGEPDYNPVYGYQEDPANYDAIAQNAQDLFQPDASGQTFTFSVDDNGTLIATPNAARGIRVRQRQKMDVIGGEAGPEIVTGTDFKIVPMSKLRGRMLPMAADGADYGSDEEQNNARDAQWQEEQNALQAAAQATPVPPVASPFIQQPVTNPIPQAVGPSTPTPPPLDPGLTSQPTPPAPTPVTPSTPNDPALPALGQPRVLDGGQSGLLSDIQRYRASQRINTNYGSAPAPAPATARPFDAAGAAAANVGQAPGALDFTQYSQGDIANLPAVQKLLGTMRANPAFQTGLDTRIPGTTTSMPTMLNLQRWLRMLPSERATLQDLYETPVEMGGLGLDWGDVAAFSQRAAPVGSGLQTQAAYGR